MTQYQKLRNVGGHVDRISWVTAAAELGNIDTFFAFRIVKLMLWWTEPASETTASLPAAKVAETRRLRGFSIPHPDRKSLQQTEPIQIWAWIKTSKVRQTAQRGLSRWRTEDGDEERFIRPQQRRGGVFPSSVKSWEIIIPDLSPRSRHSGSGPLSSAAISHVDEADQPQPARSFAALFLKSHTRCKGYFNAT